MHWSDGNMYALERYLQEQEDYDAEHEDDEEDEEEPK